MSEEILKALMQLFAIIAKQDGSVISGHEKYVRDFLGSQLSIERVEEYLKLYIEYFEDVKLETKHDTDKVRTSMKDSVRTLAICKKINKTLAQKQKVIVLLRLIEFFKNDSEGSQNRLQIVETVADVFKIEKSEFIAIKGFVLNEDLVSVSSEIVITDETNGNLINAKHIISFANYNGNLRFHFIKSINSIILKYIGTAENYLNGILIKPNSVYIFPQGSTLRLPQTTIYYSNIVAKFLETGESAKFSFNAHIKEHVFPNGKKALHELSIGETGGNLIGIMGASGSGKTTLLTILSGQDEPTNGEILINEFDLYKNSNELKGLIGFVPQDDLLIEDLTVYQNLYFNSKLCFKNLTDIEVKERIQKTLSSLGLDEIKDIKVGNALNKKISGGQRKRLNIALELIREPNILFLDEPTSGLSSRDSENVMDLLKELTIKGKLVFVVIHQPSSDIYKMFDKLLILDTGGYASYYGNPIEGVMYFKKLTNQINCELGECQTCGSVNPETIFNLIELKEINEYGNYTDQRKITPKQFYQFYKTNIFNKVKVDKIKGFIETKFELPNLFVQSKYYFLRDLRSKLSNKQYLILNALEVPLLVTFLSLIIRYIDNSKNGVYTYYNNYNIPAYIFMSIVAALLVGLTISAEEIFKDQKILKRERILHLSRFSYLMSKVALLFSVSIIHSILYVAIGHLILGIQFNYFNYFIMMFSVFSFANLLGLILSSSFNSPVTIYIIIPLIIIPQMLLGGAMFNYNKLNELFGGGNRVPMVANFMISRWAYEATVTDLVVNNDYERDRFIYDKVESKINYKLVYFIPKLEELLQSGDSTKVVTNETLQLVKREVIDDYYTAKGMGYKGNELVAYTRPEMLNYLSKIKLYYTDKLNQVMTAKELFLTNQVGNINGFGDLEAKKEKLVNSKLKEVGTAAVEKDKIVVTQNGVEQVIDPIYQDVDDKFTLISIKAPFLTAHKYLFGKLISTFNFNLIVIWFFNVLLFMVLYYDLFKNGLALLNKVKPLRK